VRRRATGRGMISILVWSTSVPVSRIVLEAFGLYLGTAITLLAAGLFLFLLTSRRERGVGWVGRLTRLHLAVCGPLFVGYILLLYGAVGTAVTRPEAIAAGLANYLWPSMILLFSVLILRARARADALTIGVAVSLAGIVLAASVNVEGVSRLVEALLPPPLSFGLGLAAAVCWGLYSVIARVFRQSNSSGAVSIFLLIAGGASLAIAVSGGGLVVPDWGFPHAAIAVAAAAYMALLPNSLAYWFWDVAIRDGDVPTLGAIANLIPILSAAIGTLVLGIGVRPELLAGAGLVAVGSAVSRLSFRRAAADPATPSAGRSVRRGSAARRIRPGSRDPSDPPSP